MSSSLLQVKGIDTKVETFTPSRANPVARRTVRSYLAQQPVEGTDIFSNLSFQIEQTSPTMVINEMRLIFPLRLQAMSNAEEKDGGGPEPLSMATNSWKQGSNIAVAQNAPFSAFRNLEVAINGKVYTEQFEQYGRCLGQCHQTFSELQFQNDESLKPIANNFVGSFEPAFDVLEPGFGGRRHTIDNFKPEPTSFSLLENNSGFIARRRAFEEGLSGDGLTWEGEISSLFNTSLFNAEARAQGNQQIPYVRSLYVNGVFAQERNRLDEIYSLPHENQKAYTRVIPQRLFEFLTPFTAAFPGSTRRTPDNHFAFGYTLEWTSQPRIEIEWVSYQQPLLRDVYRLRGFQWQLEQSYPFRIPFITNDDARVTAFPEDRQWVSVQLNRQILAVPNLIYIWVEPTTHTSRHSFAWGGMFRTCDIRSVKIRVNGQVEIVSNPSMETLYKWYKRNTNNVHEFPTYLKNKIIVISPSEIGLTEFLAQDAKVSVFDISLETTQSRLMLPEMARFHDQNARLQAGYRTPFLDLVTYPSFLNENHTAGHNNRFVIDQQTFTKNRHGNYTIARRKDQDWYLRTGNQWTVADGGFDDETGIPTRQKLYRDFLEGKTWYIEALPEEKFMVSHLENVFYQWSGGFSYWVRVNVESGAVQPASGKDKVQLWVTSDTHTFGTEVSGYFSPRLLDWNYFYDEDAEHPDNDGSVLASTFHSSAYINSETGGHWLSDINTCANSMRGSVFYKDYGADMRTNLGRPTARWNQLYSEKISILRRSAMNKDRLCPAEYAKSFIFTCDEASSQIDVSTGEKMDKNGQDAGHEGFVDEDALFDGWRWVRMKDPKEGVLTGAAGGFNVVANSGEDPIDNYTNPRINVMVQVDVNRGAEGTRVIDIPIDDRDLVYHTSDHARPLGVDSTEYSLNCLFEYNNQTVLMDASRGKPLHYSNNVTAQ